MQIINGKATLNPERKKKKQMSSSADAKFAATYISNWNLQKFQLTLFDKTKRWNIYIYRVDQNDQILQENLSLA